MPGIKKPKTYLRKLDTLWETKEWFEKNLKERLEKEDDGTILNALIWIENAHSNLRRLLDEDQWGDI